MNYASLFAACVLGGLSLTLPVQAAPMAWSSSANGCVPTAASTNANRLATSSYVSHLGANVDPITLVCPVTNLRGLTSIGWQFSLTYLDSTGKGTGAFVKAALMKQSRTTGATSTVVTVSSDASAVAAVNVRSAIIVPNFDLDANVYYVQIVLDRTTTAQTVRAYSVALEPTDV